MIGHLFRSALYVKDTEDEEEEEDRPKRGRPKKAKGRRRKKYSSRGNYENWSSGTVTDDKKYFQLRFPAIFFLPQIPCFNYLLTIIDLFCNEISSRRRCGR